MSSSEKRFSYDKKEYKKFFTEFLKLYRSMPCLWNKNCEEHKDYKFKNDNYQVLLNKYREKYPKAKLKNVKIKIHQFRSNYKRERQRFRNLSKVTTKNNLKPKKPSLWYFDYLKFLDDIDISVDRYSISSENEEQQNKNDEIVDLVDSKENIHLLEHLDFLNFEPPVRNENITDVSIELEAESESGSGSCVITNEGENKEIERPSRKKQRKLVNMPEQNAIESEANDEKEESERLHRTEPSDPPLIVSAQSLNEYPDNIDKLTDLWASKLRQMSSSQQLYAEKFIHEILFEGVLGNLNRNSVQINSINTSSSSIPLEQPNVEIPGLVNGNNHLKKFSIKKH